MNAIDRKLEILAKCIGALSGELNAVNLENEILKSLFLDLIARKHPDMIKNVQDYWENKVVKDSQSTTTDAISRAFSEGELAELRSLFPNMGNDPSLN